MRRTKLSLLTLLIFFTFFPSIAQDFEYEGIWYTVIDTDAKTCRTKDGNRDEDAQMDVPGNKIEGDVTIPTLVSDGTNDYTVTAIGDRAFYGCTELTSINIPESVTSILYRAFDSCSNLTSINIPDGVTSIGASILQNCSSLTSIILPDGVTTIGHTAFLHCSSLTSINIPDGVTSIGTAAFEGCSSLTSINLPDGVTSIENDAFYGCSNLTSINIPDGVTSIGERAFSGCSSLTSIFIPEEVTSIGNYAFQACSSLSSINFPDGVTSIGEHTFSGCSSLTSINIPAGITSIGEYAFAYCYNAEDITYLAETPITAPENTFDRLYSSAMLNTPNATLADVQATVPWNNFKHIIANDGSIGILTTGDDFEYNGINYTVIDPHAKTCRTKEGSYLGMEEGYRPGSNCIGDVVIPATVSDGFNIYTVVAIGHNSFVSCSDLISIEIQAQVPEILTNAFLNCSNLTSVILPESLTSIGDHTFENCSKLTSINLPEGIESIGYSAFRGCTSLTSMIIPDKVKSIDEYAFSNCTGFSSITIPESVTFINNWAFDGLSADVEITYNAVSPITSNSNIFSDITYQGATLNTPNATLAAVQATVPWNKFQHIVAKDGSISPSLAAGTDFEYQGILYTVLDADAKTVKTKDGIADGSSEGVPANEAVGNLVIPATVTYEDSEYTVTEIGHTSFQYNHELTSVILPNTITTISWDGFYGCSTLKSVEMLEGVVSLGHGAFFHCENLTYITLPASLLEIEREVFDGCYSLESVTYNAEVLRNTYNGFERNVYENAVLYTPYAVIADVRATEPWSNFKHIVAKDGSIEPALAAGTDFEYQGIWYTVLDADAKTCETKHGDWNTDAQIPIPGNNCIGDVTIPSTVSDGTNNYTVIALGYGAFEGCSELTSIQLPESIISIGSCAFRFCSNLKSINIPDGVTSIEYSAFSGCSSLTSINIPDGVTSIESDTFEGCSSLTSIKIPDGVTTIGGFAFNKCSNLTSVNISDAVTSIGDYAFEYCTNLTSINIPDGVTSIGYWVFASCSSLISINIPDGVTSIGEYAFNGCSSLTSINIPAALASIGECAFLNCDKLEEVTYNASTLIEAPENLFNSYNGDIYGIATLNTPNATLAAVQATVPWNKFQHIVAKDGSLKPGLAAGTDFEYEGIWYTVLDADAKTCETKHGDWDNDASMPIAGNNCVGDVTIPSKVSDGTTDYTVTALGGHAFSNCSDLTSIILPESITSISVYAFYGCSSLTSINIPNGVTSIDWGAFVGCSSLASIKIPEVLTLIDGRAFESCSSLTSINIPDGVTSIGEMAFEGCSNLTSINIPDGVTSIGSSVFWGCSSLTSINIPDGLTSIGQSAFSGCSSLTSINIPDGVTSIESGTFWGCSSLTSINIPNGVTSIEGHAFYDCTNLTSINIADGVTLIGEGAFSGCSSLTSINIPAGITSIGEYAFACCYNAEEITYLSETPITAPENTFDDLYSTATLNTPNATLAAVKATVPWNKFTRIIASDGSIGINLALGEQFNMNGVVYTVIDEENNLVETAAGSSIEEGAINYSGDLVISSPIVYNRISFTVTEIGDYSFAGSDHLTSVTIPASIVNIGENAFADCERLTSVIWQGDTRLQSGVVESIANPNLLVYVNSSSSAPEGLDHNIVVMNTADGIPSCENMILEKGYAFHPAIDFVSQDSRMTQDYTQSTIIGQSAGWETIVLPFDATSIYSEKQDELTPFAAVTNLEIQYPFWLYEADSQYEWKEATGIKAGVPYIISMPNNPDYIERFNIDGPVTFACSEPAMITGAVASPYAVNWTSGQDFSSMWLPLDAEQAANAMGLNVGIDNATDENGELLPPGSAFIQGVTPRPLDAFVTRTGAARIKKVVGDHSDVLALRGDYGFEIKSVDGEIILKSDTDRKIDIFAIDGTLIRSIMLRAGVAETLRDITPGIYLIAGKKVIIR